MERYRKGLLVKSKAGHDKGQIFVIADLDESYIYLTDGKNRPLDKLKKKKIKHVQLINLQHDLEKADDAQIRKIIREYK